MHSLPCQKTRIVMVAIFVVSPINQAYCKYESTCYKCSTYLSQAARTQPGGRQWCKLKRDKNPKARNYAWEPRCSLAKSRGRREERERGRETLFSGNVSIWGGIKFVARATWGGRVKNWLNLIKIKGTRFCPNMIFVSHNGQLKKPREKRLYFSPYFMKE